jgi:VanZ family protein
MTHQRNAKLKGVLPVILVMGINLFMSTLPVDQAGEAIQQVSGPPRDIIRQVPAIPRSIRVDWGKIGHVIGYGVLGLVLYRATCLSGHTGLLLPTTLVFGFACLDEFVQYFVPGRSARLSDVILDTTAALLVMVVIKLLADRWASVR